jgi:hypothetical protein
MVTVNAEKPEVDEHAELGGVPPLHTALPVCNNLGAFGRWSCFPGGLRLFLGLAAGG